MNFINCSSKGNCFVKIKRSATFTTISQQIIGDKLLLVLIWTLRLITFKFLLTGNCQ